LIVHRLQEKKSASLLLLFAVNREQIFFDEFVEDGKSVRICLQLKKFWSSSPVWLPRRLVEEIKWSNFFARNQERFFFMNLPFAVFFGTELCCSVLLGQDDDRW